MTAGLVIWALHFTGVYLWTALVCARGWQVSIPWSISLMTLAALMALAWVLWQCIYGSWRTAQHADARAAEEYLFAPRIAAFVAAFGMVAVVWEAMPAVWTRGCGL